MEVVSAAGRCEAPEMPTNQREIRVAVIEDDRATREGMKLLLGATPGFRLAGAWGSIEEARAVGSAAKPEVVLLDVRLPGLSGSEAVPELTRLWSGVQIVMLTSLEDEATVVEALSNGAVGYVLKRTPPAKILDSVREVADGGSPMSPEIARRVVSLLARPGGPSRAGAAAAEVALTEQERRLLRLLADGHSYLSASEALGISVNTVRNHIRSLYEKLQVHTRSEAVGKALRGGVI